MSTAYVLLNSDLGTDVSIITEIKQILVEENVEYEVRGVYGVYDIVLKISSDDAEKLRAIITNRIRKRKTGCTTTTGSNKRTNSCNCWIRTKNKRKCYKT